MVDSASSLLIFLLFVFLSLFIVSLILLVFAD